MHRGMVLGMLAGAAAEKIPPKLKGGLANRDALTQEIDGFTDISQPLPDGPYCNR